MSINSALTLAYNQLSTFAGLDDFWGRFDTAFGANYDRTMALTFLILTHCVFSEIASPFAIEGRSN